jgi:hypothetical protein
MRSREKIERNINKLIYVVDHYNRARLARNNHSVLLRFAAFFVFIFSFFVRILAGRRFLKTRRWDLNLAQIGLEVFEREGYKPNILRIPGIPETTA